MKPSVAHTGLLLLIALGALAFRVVQLDRRPMHCDEANQAVKAGLLQETGSYRYDPQEHHGPSLYFLSLPLARLHAGRRFADTTEWTFRMVPAVFGAGLVLLLYLARDALGWPSVLGAALLTAISPAMVFYSRFYIQETLLVFFTFGALAGGWRYARSGQWRWALLTGACLGLMIATKETSVIAYMCMAVALAVTVVRHHRAQASGPAAWARVDWRHVLAGLAVAGLVSALLFSSFLTHPRGVLDSLLCWRGYLARGTGNGDHIHASPVYYLRMLTWIRYGRGPIWSEALILGLAAVGGVAALRSRGESRAFLSFLTVYTLLMTLTYSLIPYKTPWCMLSFLHAMIVLAGFGATVLVRAPRRVVVRLGLGVLLAAGVADLARRAGRASFRYRADPRNPYVYAHTSTDFLRLAKRVDEIGDVTPEQRDMLIFVVASAHDTWPLPWYLRGYRRVGYWQDAEQLPDHPSPALVIASTEAGELLEARFDSEKYLVEYYGLRPGVLLALYIRRDLWDVFLSTRSVAKGGRL